MADIEKLLSLAKSKLNITWNSDDTDARVTAIIEESMPMVANMVGLDYDYEADNALDDSGEVFDFSAPSMERNVFLNFVAYEWNHKADLFRAAYWEEIAACRQRHALESLEAEDDGSIDGE